MSGVLSNTTEQRRINTQKTANAFQIDWRRNGSEDDKPECLAWWHGGMLSLNMHGRKTSTTAYSGRDWRADMTGVMRRGVSPCVTYTRVGDASGVFRQNCKVMSTATRANEWIVEALKSHRGSLLGPAEGVMRSALGMPRVYTAAHLLLRPISVL